MPVQLVCPCGKQLRISDDHAGRRQRDAVPGVRAGDDDEVDGPRHLRGDGRPDTQHQ